MELGICLPTYGPYVPPQTIVRIAQEAERIGYAAVWTYERLLRPTAPVSMRAGSPPAPVPETYSVAYDPLETLAYVAAVTKRVKLGVSVLDAPFHVPVMLAKRLATIDQFSAGRVIAGLGQGWMPQEFATANIPMKRRGRGVEEFVAAMRATWAPDPVRFDGDFYSIAESQINPKPVQPGGIPILMGVMTPPAIERAGQFADGLNPIAVSAQFLEGAIARFQTAAHAAGRDPAKLAIIVRANTPIVDAPMAEDRPFLGGSPEQIAQDVDQIRSLEIDQVFFNSPTIGREPLDLQVRLLERLKQAAG